MNLWASIALSCWAFALAGPAGRTSPAGNARPGVLAEGDEAMPRDALLDGVIGAVRRTPDGLVQGVVGKKTVAWRGIPFAAPPIGKLRFSPPQPPKKWSGVLDATDFGASCMQMGAPQFNGSMLSHSAWASINTTKSDEDCLFANVYAPVAPPAGKLLPVMVYLHAGEFRFGSSNDAESNWPFFLERFSGSSGDTAVLVTGNVRLGVLGFAALDELRPRDPLRSSGNYGVQDQRALLAWVQRSIRSFGGDPARVTMFGESSGGTSVGFHLLSSRSKGLFAQAILESPGLTQSKSWQQSSQDTLFVAAALTAASSPSCGWPAAKQQQAWLAFEGVVAHAKSALEHHAGMNATAAMELCAARADCYLVAVEDMDRHASGASLYGGGTPGQLVDNGTFISNITAREGRAMPGNAVYVRVPDSETVADCLTAAAAVDLVALDTSPPWGDTFRTDAAAPTVDGVELLQPLEQLARDASTVPQSVPLLAGSNLDEGTMFMSTLPAIPCNASWDEFVAWADAQYGAGLGAKVRELYSTPTQPTPLCRDYHSPSSTATSTAWAAAMRSAGDEAILCRTRALLQLAANVSGGGHHYWYDFTATPITSVNEDASDMPYMGAFHGAEVPFVFGVPNELASDGERKLSEAMGCYWLNFASTGDPNSGPTGCSASLSLPRWPSVGANGVALVMGNSSLTTDAGLKEEQCAIFARLG